jgi:hypothetical protein
MRYVEKPILNLLLKSGLVNQAQLDEAMKLSVTKRMYPGQMLIMAGAIRPSELQAAIDAESMLRSKMIDLNQAASWLNLACKKGITFCEVARFLLP